HHLSGSLAAMDYQDEKVEQSCDRLAGMVTNRPASTSGSLGGQKLVGLLAMQCPRCNSTRIQRGYKDGAILLRLGGGHELLCNNCGLEFKGFKWSAAYKRIPARIKETSRSHRGAPRYKSHLPATIRLVNPGADNEPSFSLAALG